MEPYWTGALEAIQSLIGAAFIYAAYSITRQTLESPEASAPWRVAWKGLIVCAFIALIGASQLGEPSCEDRDDRGCESYADDGYTPEKGAREKAFARLFIVLSVPMLFAVSNGNKRKM